MHSRYTRKPLRQHQKANEGNENANGDKKETSAKNDVKNEVGEKKQSKDEEILSENTKEIFHTNKTA